MQKLMSLVLLALCLPALSGVTAQGEPKPATAKIMKQKLQYSQAILAAVATEDFTGISSNADGLLELAKTQWIQNDTPEYRAQLKDFWVVLEGLKSASEEKNGDGTTLAYLQLTLSCVKCHKYLRTPVK